MIRLASLLSDPSRAALPIASVLRGTRPVVLAFVVGVAGTTATAHTAFAQTQQEKNEAADRAASLARAEKAAFAAWAAEVSNINRALLQVIRTTESILEIAEQASAGRASRQIASQTKDQLAASARAQLKNLQISLKKRFPNPRFANPSYVEQFNEAREYLFATLGKMAAIITETENTFYAALNRGADVDIDAQPATLLASATEFEAQTFELRQLAALRDDRPVEGHVLRAQIEANQAVASALVAVAENARAGNRGEEPTMQGLFEANDRVLAAQTEVELGHEALTDAIKSMESGPREKTQIRRLRTRLMRLYDHSLELSSEAIGLVDDFIRRIDGIGIPLADDPFFGRMRQIADRQRELTTARNKLTNDLIKAQIPRERPKPVWSLDDGTVLNPS